MPASKVVSMPIRPDGAEPTGAERPPSPEPKPVQTPTSPTTAVVLSASIIGGVATLVLALATILVPLVNRYLALVEKDAIQNAKIEQLKNDNGKLAAENLHLSEAGCIPTAETKSHPNQSSAAHVGAHQKLVRRTVVAHESRASLPKPAFIMPPPAKPPTPVLEEAPPLPAVALTSPVIVLPRLPVSAPPAHSVGSRPGFLRRVLGKVF
jgi:hypothetical protein